jgi:hypothetical protein
MSWAQKRKFIYIGGALIIFLIIVVWPTTMHFYKSPTCFDTKQNGDELGVDCGGSCSLLCSAQYVPLSVLWSRFSKVSDGVYNVLAYVENPNFNAGANNLTYVFKLYDKDGILLNERFGKTFAPASKILAIFAADLGTGKQVPQRVDFSFTSDPLWLKQDSKESGLSISESVLSREDSAPRLTATLTNKTINQIGNIEAVAIIYNASGNTIAFSRTIIDGLGDRASKVINFNWPKPFTEQVTRTEIVLKILN